MSLVYTAVAVKGNVEYRKCLYSSNKAICCHSTDGCANAHVRV